MHYQWYLAGQGMHNGTDYANVCDVAPGEIYTATWDITVPYWGRGIYTLKWDIYVEAVGRHMPEQSFWFSQQGIPWPMYAVDICVDCAYVYIPTITRSPATLQH